MSALDQLEQMVAAAKAQADQLEQLRAAVEEMTKAPDQTGLQGQIDALVKERDALREAIQAELDDQKTDTDRLEKAIKPVEVAPVPVVEAPATDAPKADEAAPKADEPAKESNPVQSLPNA